MTVEEALGRVGRAKENTMMAQKHIKELLGLWMERNSLSVDEILPGPEDHLDKLIERLELALTDAKTVRDNLKAQQHAG